MSCALSPARARRKAAPARTVQTAVPLDEDILPVILEIVARDRPAALINCRLASKQLRRVADVVAASCGHVTFRMGGGALTERLCAHFGQRLVTCTLRVIPGHAGELRNLALLMAQGMPQLKRVVVKAAGIGELRCADVAALQPLAARGVALSLRMLGHTWDSGLPAVGSAMEEAFCWHADEVPALLQHSSLRRLMFTDMSKRVPKTPLQDLLRLDSFRATYPWRRAAHSTSTDLMWDKATRTLSVGFKPYLLASRTPDDDVFLASLWGLDEVARHVRAVFPAADLKPINKLRIRQLDVDVALPLGFKDGSKVWLDLEPLARDQVDVVRLAHYSDAATVALQPDGETPDFHSHVTARLVLVGSHFGCLRSLTLQHPYYWPLQSTGVWHLSDEFFRDLAVQAPQLRRLWIACILDSCGGLPSLAALTSLAELTLMSEPARKADCPSAGLPPCQPLVALPPSLEQLSLGPLDSDDLSLLDWDAVGCNPDLQLSRIERLAIGTFECPPAHALAKMAPCSTLRSLVLWTPVSDAGSKEALLEGVRRSTRKLQAKLPSLTRLGVTCDPLRDDDPAVTWLVPTDKVLAAQLSKEHSAVSWLSGCVPTSDIVL